MRFLAALSRKKRGSAVKKKGAAVHWGRHIVLAFSTGQTAGANWKLNTVTIDDL